MLFRSGVITISGFNPIRRQVAKKALENLIKDGRIHPAKIEEVVKKAEKEIDEEIKKAGEQAAREAKVREDGGENQQVEGHGLATSWERVEDALK